MHRTIVASQLTGDADGMEGAPPPAAHIPTPEEIALARNQRMVARGRDDYIPLGGGGGGGGEQGCGVGGRGRGREGERMRER